MASPVFLSHIIERRMASPIKKEGDNLKNVRVNLYQKANLSDFLVAEGGGGQQGDAVVRKDEIWHDEEIQNNEKPLSSPGNY